MMPVGEIVGGTRLYGGILSDTGNAIKSNKYAIIMLALPELRTERVILWNDLDAGTITATVFPGSSVVVNPCDPRSLKGWIEEMVPTNLLADVLKASLARAAESEIDLMPEPHEDGAVQLTEACISPAVDRETEPVTGKFSAAKPTDASMEPHCPKGDFVIFDSSRSPQDGDIVIASVTGTREMSRPHWWQFRLKRRWQESQELADEFELTIRRYGHDIHGAVALTPSAEDFPAWTEGIQDGKITEVCVLGVATEYKPAWIRSRMQRSVQTVMSRV